MAIQDNTGLWGVRKDGLFGSPKIHSAVLVVKDGELKRRMAEEDVECLRSLL